MILTTILVAFSAANLALAAVSVPFEKRPIAITAFNDLADYEYMVTIAVGTPPQPLVLQYDTGSYTTWVTWSGSDVCVDYHACGNGSFDPSISSSYVEIAPNLFSIEYAGGDGITGDYINETLTFGGASVTNMTIVLGKNYTFPANQTSDVLGIYGGILAVGLPLENIDTPPGTGEAITYPSILALMVEQGIIANHTFSVYFDAVNASSGTIIFGGVDTSKYYGDLVTVPVISYPGSETPTWAVTLDSVGLVSSEGTINCSSGTSLNAPAFVDTGTSFTYIPTAIGNAILNSVGAIANSEYGYLVLCALSHQNINVTFGLGNSSNPVIAIPISQFISPLLPASKPPVTINESEVCVFGLGPAGPPDGSGEPQPVLLGDTFLRGVYAVFDVDNVQMGFAAARFE